MEIDMINKASIWHVTPVHIGTEFFDQTTSVLEANEDLYNIVNDESLTIVRARYTVGDYNSIKRMRAFLHNVKSRIADEKFKDVKFCEVFPNINGCISKFQITDKLYCYIMYNGTAVFLDYGDAIHIDDERYFSIPLFLERQQYEDDYCANREVSERKKPLYDFLELLWLCMGSEAKHFSTSKEFRNNGVSYTLCVGMIDAPDLKSNKLDETFLKNINAMLDTAPFNNIYDESQWELIKTRVDEYDTNSPQIKELSENLIFADSWSGVIVAGDLSRNRTCITWLMEFEIVLQSMWLLFDAYCENVLRQDLSVMELQSILSRVELMKVSLDNDISSNMEQARHIMRTSLIDSSDIDVIYSRMHGMLENKLKLQSMSEDKRKSKYSLLSDIALLAIALMEIYGVIVEILRADSFGKEEIFAVLIMMSIATICVWAMVKGKK